MNIFNKIQQNIKHGSVTLTIQAPQSMSLYDKSLDIKVTLSNKAKQAHTISKVDAQIEATENNSTYGMLLNNSVQRGNTTDSNEMYTMQAIIIAEAADTKSFVLQPNESKTIALTVAVKNSPAKDKVKHFRYEIEVNAKIEGIDLGPKAQQDLQILQ